MSWLLAILLLAISKTAVSQCDYIYVAEPPTGQLICDPFPINRLQLVCSIFVDASNIRQDEVLTIRWFFSAPVNRLFNPANAVQLQQATFLVDRRDIFTSRIVVSSPPIGYYFCQPSLLLDRRQLIRSNTATLQPPNVFQQRNIRPCLENEFQNSSVPFCAIQGVALGPNQDIAPAPVNVDDINVQYITPTAVNLVTPTAPLTLVVQPTPVPATQANIINDISPDNGNAGLIAGVVIGVVIIFAITIIAIVGIVVFYQIWKKKNDSKFPRWNNSRRILNEDRYAAPPVNPGGDVPNDLEVALLPPSKPPPQLMAGLTNSHRHTTDHHYNRLNRSSPKPGKNSSVKSRSVSESSAYYIIPDHDKVDGIVYYGEEHTGHPYIDDESESLIYTDSHYGAESDIHLQQERKQQEFVRSSSLGLESDEEGARTREAASTINAVNHSQHKYQNCVPKGKYDNAVLSPTSEEVTASTPYYQEIIATRELKTEYTSADILESTAM